MNQTQEIFLDQVNDTERVADNPLAVTPEKVVERLSVVAEEQAMYTAE